jgi:outer membrane cobalamin receptor
MAVKETVLASNARTRVPGPIIVTLLAAAFAPAHAEEARDAIVVTASLDDPAADGVGPVRTIAARDVRALSPVTALEALTLVPGVDAFEKGGAGGGSYIAVRGGEPNFALVTINGVRVNDPMQSSGGGFDFSLHDPAMVESMAVVSGPQSTAYGADALSGVIALRFGPGEGRQGVAARAGVGSHGRHALSGQAALAGEAGSLAIAAGMTDTRDFHPGSRSESTSAMLAASPNLGEAASLDLFGFYASADSTGFPEDSGGPELAIVRELEQREREQLALGATFAADIAPGAKAQLRGGWSRSEFTSQSPGIAPGVLDAVPPIASDSRFDRFEVVGSVDAAAGEWLTASLGGAYIHETGRSTGTLDFGFPIPTDYRLSRDMPGLFASATWRHPGGATLRAGLRADFPEGGKTRLTPRIGAQVPVAEGLELRATYGEGFKRPSLFALGFPLIANPDLKDELARTFDAGLGWTSPDGAWRGDLTYFHATYRNLIDFEPELFTNVNRQRITSEGIEVALSGSVRAVRLLSSLTYMKTRSSDGAQLRFRPRWKGRLVAVVPLAQDWSLRLDGAFSSAFTDSSVPTGFQRLGGYEQASAEVTWRIVPDVELSLAVRNLFDQRSYRTIGTPEPGRNVFVALRKTL